MVKGGAGGNLPRLVIGTNIYRLPPVEGGLSLPHVEDVEAGLDLGLHPLLGPGDVVTLRADGLVEGDDSAGLEEGDQGALVGGELLVGGDLEDVTDIDTR